ncbi:MAG: hypothetical protein AB4290_02805 [Spirulina sp.]
MDDKILSQGKDFPDPVFNINVALQMLQTANTSEQRDRYCRVTKSPYARKSHNFAKI